MENNGNRQATLAYDLGLMLKRELTTFCKEIELLPDEESLWKVLQGITNPVGTLALHVAGNLRYFVGAVIGGSSYKRNRDAEFSLRGLTREQVIEELNCAIEEVEAGLKVVTDSMLTEKYPVAIHGITMPTSRFLLGLEAHAAFHLGEASYLRRILTGENITSDAVSLEPLAD